MEYTCSAVIQDLENQKVPDFDVKVASFGTMLVLLQNELSELHRVGE